MYKFRKASVEDDKEIIDKMPLCGNWIYNSGGSEQIYALFLGKMIALFGDSGNMSDDWENMYGYQIIAEADNGRQFCIEVYHGPGGPSVSVPDENLEDEYIDDYKQATKELVEYIEKAEPADYVWESVYYDIPANVKYMVKDGRAYVETAISECDF